MAADGASMTAANLDGEICDGHHVMAVRVYFEDTDFSHAVYHASYLRFMERGRTNYLRLLGVEHRELFEQSQTEAPGFSFVVRSMSIEFLKPAFMDDLLHIITMPAQISGASITLLQRCERAQEILVAAHVRVAFICNGKAQRIPKPLRSAMECGLRAEGRPISPASK